MHPSPDEVRQELDRLLREGGLAPQERALLQAIVHHTVQSETGQLYQKALAEAIGIESPKQIGVLATRLRSKLSDHYGRQQAPPLLEIQLRDRGYEAHFAYRPALTSLSDGALLLVADARAALDQRTLPGIEAALVFVGRALSEEPAHPLLRSLKAQCHATRALYGVQPLTDLRTAEAIVNEIGPGADRPWEYWFALASVRMSLQWDWAGAEAAFGRAIALSNGDARFNAWHTALLACQGRTGEAVEHLRLAVLRVPDSPIIRADLAINQIYAGQLDAAEDTIHSAFALFGERSHYLLHVHLAILHEARGDAAKAAKAIHRVPLKWPKTAITLGLRALFCGLGGQDGVARWHMSKLQGIRFLAGAKVPAIHLAVAALGAGDKDAAVEWLRQASLVERDPHAVLNNVYPFFRHLHRHPGFRQLVGETMKLPLSD
jgi:Flp pilus assembly protein TadD